MVDSKPFAEELLDRHLEDRREGSQLVAGRIARIVEQGMGRAVRGEKDYCVILIIGSDLVRALQAPGQRNFFSDQTRTQIELGREIGELAKVEIAEGKDPAEALMGLLNQSLNRDPDWKTWYVERMNQMEPRNETTRAELLKLFAAEVKAERAFIGGNVDEAVRLLQQLLDDGTASSSDRGWFLQEMSRYSYPTSKARSNELQRSAHKENRNLLRPKDGMIFTPVATLTPEKRLERIRDWLSGHESFGAVATRVDEIMTRLSFGVIADHFEQALKDLASALGFESDRPDKEWKEGPDNLWGLRDNEYLLIECKSQVESTRSEIHKDETDQMNRSCSWFGRCYPGSQVTRVLIIPTRKLSGAAAFNEDVLIVTKKELDLLTRNVRAFFNEFRSSDLRDLSTRQIDEHLRRHKLTVVDLKDYGQKPRGVQV